MVLLPHVLLVEDEPQVRDVVSDAFRQRNGVRVLCAGTKAEALTRFSVDRPRTVLLDLGLPDGSGIDLIEIFLRLEPTTRIIVLTGTLAPENAEHIMKRGAIAVLPKPIPFEELFSQVESPFETTRPPRPVSSPGALLVGEGRGHRALLERIGRVAPVPATVLITGEEGTGKALVARAVHAASGRSHHPFVVVDAAAMSGATLERALLGEERGGGGGATAGFFERARGGTLFFDEIAHASLELQRAVVRALDRRVIRRLGGALEIPIDVRLVAATSQDLASAVAAGRFRRDLFFRLHATRLEVPPLRARPEAIGVLAEHFLRRCHETFELPRMRFSAEALHALEAHAWPGNVRELESVVEGAAAMAEGTTVEASDLAFAPLPLAGSATRTTALAAASSDDETLRLDVAERRLLILALERAGGNKRRAATFLGVNRATLYNMCRRHGVGAKRLTASEPEGDEKG